MAERGRVADAEIDTRIEAVKRLLLKGLKKGDIKRAAGKQFNVSYQQVEDYMTRAREDIRAENIADRDLLLAESTDFYVRAKNDEKQPMQARIRAQENIDLLYGLHHQPTQKPQIVIVNNVGHDPAKALLEKLGDDPEDAQRAYELFERHGVFDAIAGPPKAIGVSEGLDPDVVQEPA